MGGSSLSDFVVESGRGGGEDGCFLNKERREEVDEEEGDADAD